MRAEWVKLPTAWIEAGGLARFQWRAQKSEATAALMLLIAIAHVVDQQSGKGRATYDELCEATSLSRASAAAGLGLLERLAVIKSGDHRSVYELVGFDPTQGWGKLPSKRLYSAADRIEFFKEFHLRGRIELNALKLYLLIVTRRDQATNYAHMTYDQIEKYLMVERVDIRSAISFLAGNGLMHVDHFQSVLRTNGVSNAYRLSYIAPYNHMGTGSARAGAFFGEDAG